MARSYGGISVKIDGDYNNKDIKRAIRDLKALEDDAKETQGKFAGMSKGMKMAGVAVAAAAAGMAVAVGKFAMSSINAASDLDESLSKTQTVFGDASGAVEKFAKDASTNLGLSEQAALEATSTFGNLFTAMGINAGKAAGLSQEVVTLAADLASFNNIDVQEAITALRSGLVGETEPLRRLGVNLSAARIEAYALESGLVATKGQLDAAAKAQAAWALITQDAATASGDFSRTSDGLANSQRILKAAVDNATASVGVGLVNALQDVIGAIGGPGGAAEAIETAGHRLGLFVEGLATASAEMGDVEASALDQRREIERLADVYRDAGGGVGGFIAIVRNMGHDSTISPIEVIGQASRDAAAAIDAMGRVMAGSVKPADHLASSLSDLRVRTDEAANAAARYVAETGVQLFQIQAANKTYRDAAVRSQRLAEEQDNVSEAVSSAGSSARSAGSGFDDLASRIDSARQSAVRGIQDMRQKLRDELEQSRQEFNDYAASVSQSIRGSISFADAAPEFDEEGNRVGMTFIEALQAQATRAQEFATKVKTLIAMGLSQEALQQVLAAGVQAGTSIANELISGGATTIEQTNELVATSQAAADEVGVEAAESFFGAGVTTAQKTYEGFKANFGKGGPARKALMGVMDRLAEAAARQVRIDVAVTRNINEVVTRVVQTITAPVQARAMGGPVEAGSPYLIGERGPELFVPEVSGTVISNADMRSGGGTPVGGGVTLNVYAGMGTDGAEVGRQIVDALKAYERRNGAVYASA